MTACALFESFGQRMPAVRATAEAYHRDPRRDDKHERGNMTMLNLNTVPRKTGTGEARGGTMKTSVETAASGSLELKRAALLSRQPHATFCGSRRRVTASGDPVAEVKPRRASRQEGKFKPCLGHIRTP